VREVPKQKKKHQVHHGIAACREPDDERAGIQSRTSNSPTLPAGKSSQTRSNTQVLDLGRVSHADHPHNDSETHVGESWHAGAALQDVVLTLPRLIQLRVLGSMDRVCAETFLSVIDLEPWGKLPFQCV